MRTREAIILAGGMGTRLKSVIADLPKPMAPINEKPFLEYMLNYLKRYKIEHVVLSVGYKWKEIEGYFGKSFNGMQLSYAIEEEPLGTGGGIRLAMNSLKGNDCFILNGDTFFDVNLHDLAEFHYAHQADLCITVKRKRDFFRYGTVKLEVCKVSAFEEKKPVKSGLINGGVYITHKQVFDQFDLPDKFSFERDFMEKYLSDLKIFAMRCSEYFIDIGIPADYEKAGKDLPSLLKI